MGGSSGSRRSWEEGVPEEGAEPGFEGRELWGREGGEGEGEGGDCLRCTGGS